VERFLAATSARQRHRGRALRYFRIEQRHWTQADLARHAKVSVNTVTRAELRGVRNELVYLKMRRALGLTEDDVQRWIDARPLDTRLLPFMRWFESLSPREQGLFSQLLTALVTARHPRR